MMQDDIQCVQSYASWAVNEKTRWVRLLIENYIYIHTQISRKTYIVLELVNRRYNTKDFSI